MVIVRNITGCGTSAIRELDRQIVKSMGSNALVSFEDLNVEALGEGVWFYLQPAAKEALQRAISDRGKKLGVFSAYRTIAQQFLLFKQFQEGRCGITAAARPPFSNHQSGLALDIEDHLGWKPFLEDRGWQWIGDRDPAHFDFVGRGTIDLAEINVLAFQRLWNQNNPNDIIDEDGDYGQETERRLADSPAEGFLNRRGMSGIGMGIEDQILRLTQPPMTGINVNKIQEALVATLVNVGISIEVNGIFDAATELAVKKFQEQKGLSVDGIVGPNTWKILGVKEDVSKLGEILNKKLVIKLDELTADKELVREIQRRLNALGLLQLSDVDGIFANVTKNALTRFCDSVFLNNMNTGLFGPAFFQKLMDRRGTPNVPSFPSDAPGSLPKKLAFALQFTLIWEGGYVDHPLDLGGPTNKGITQRNYDTYRIAKGLPTKEVKFIEEAEVMEIYSEMYWKPSQADSMILPLAIVHFDTAVLFGVRGAVQFLQEALGVGVDGIFGPQTESGMGAKNNKETALSIINGRIAYHHNRVKENPSQDVFLQGWVNRANDLREFITGL
ncbi:peptidoglycan-binding protein [Kamptonema animale CS-326]|jgi:lysozyme family protein|uniref:peptidoglycan-binding protein n=1 Tax=Kamptonema animale TaxID=92934 RepID=UPI0023306728|nr:peptidoglycan-binding protein [Kamptonema animale]MDB9513036.1 peptidoglycan-binding protein [Kamptonema animale CS-326]